VLDVLDDLSKGSTSADKDDSSLVGRAATASLFFGLIGLMTFPYFVNRSTTPSLGIFQVFVAIIVVASFTLLEVDKLQMTSRRSILMLLLMVTPQALLLGSIIQMPNGYDEWRRVADLQSTTYGGRLAEVQQAVSFSEETLNRKIDYFSIGQGNLYLGNNEMRNISLIDDPSELNDPLMLGTSMLARFCEHLDIYAKVEKQFVLVENFYEIKSGLPLCKNYRTILSISEKFSVVVRARQ
jgi:multisubunit Na+/H+ antiporter MnhG subunit